MDNISSHVLRKVIAVSKPVDAYIFACPEVMVTLLYKTRHVLIVEQNEHPVTVQYERLERPHNCESFTIVTEDRIITIHDREGRFNSIPKFLVHTDSPPPEITDLRIALNSGHMAVTTKRGEQTNVRWVNMLEDGSSLEVVKQEDDARTRLLFVFVEYAPIGFIKLDERLAANLKDLLTRIEERMLNG